MTAKLASLNIDKVKKASMPVMNTERAQPMKTLTSNKPKAYVPRQPMSTLMSKKSGDSSIVKNKSPVRDNYRTEVNRSRRQGNLQGSSYITNNSPHNAQNYRSNQLASIEDDSMGDEEEAHEVNKVVNRIKNYHLQDS